MSQSKIGENLKSKGFFFQQDITNTSYSLHTEESSHIAKVLRLKVGDPIHITNGKGLLQLGMLTFVSPQKCQIEVKESLHQPKRNYAIHIAMAPTKQLSRMEWFVEKATEIGVDQISFLRCKNSERQSINLTRIRKKAISALKQSQQAWLPTFDAMVNLGEFIKVYSPGLIAHIDGSALPMKKVIKQNSNYVILIGPEGGFTANEIEKAKKNGFQLVSLGENRLRTETAGVAACSVLNFINQ